MATRKNMNNPLPYLKPRVLFQAVFAGYFLLAMHYFSPNMGGYGLYLPFNVIGWMFIATLIGLGFWQISRTGNIEMSKMQILCWIGFLFFLLPLLYSINEISYRTTSRIMFLLGGLGFYSTLVQFRFKLSERFTLLYIILGAIAMQSILGVVQYYGLGSDNYFLLMKKTRPYGSFQQNNVMTTFMATGVGLSLYMIGKDPEILRQKWKQYLSLLMPLTGSLIIVVVKSKAGFLGLFVVLLLMLPSFNVKEKLYQRWFMMLVVGLITGWLSPTVYQIVQPKGSLYTREFADQIKTTKSRAEVYEISFDIWRDNPVTGVGYGKFPRVFREYIASRRAKATGDDYTMEEYWDHPHNETLLWLSEGGIAPFLGLLIFAGAYLIMLFRVHWQEALPFMGLIMPILLHTQFEYPFDHSLAHWITFLTLVYLPDIQDNMRYQYGLHKVMIIPALVIPLMVFDYMGTTLKNSSILTRFQGTGSNDYGLLLQVKEPGALHLKYDNSVLKAVMYSAMMTKDKAALELFLEKGEEYLRHSPKKHVYRAMEIVLKNMGRDEEAKIVVKRARHMNPDTWEYPEYQISHSDTTGLLP